jgi:CheY-like chemotaxis protein
MTDGPAPDARRSTILLVEDQTDLRELLALALSREGYVVVEAGSVIEGLRFLRDDHFAVVITHYNLPDDTGLSFLRRALAEGRLDGTAAMIITAEPGVQAESHFPVVAKPLDLQKFIDQVRRLAAPRAGIERRRVVGENVKLDLLLYYTPPWPNSVRAHDVLERVLSRFDRSQVAVGVCDLSRDSRTADEDNVLFSPTLVKRFPAPTLWIVGDLGNGEAVEELLRLNGVDEV